MVLSWLELGHHVTRTLATFYAWAGRRKQSPSPHGDRFRALELFRNPGEARSRQPVSSRLTTEPKRVVEIEWKNQRAKAPDECRLTELGSGRGVRYELSVVFGVEHGLTRRDEGIERGALVELVALFVDLKVEKRDQVGDLVEVVLQAHTQSPLVRLVGDGAVEGEL